MWWSDYLSTSLGKAMQRRWHLRVLKKNEFANWTREISFQAQKTKWFSDPLVCVEQREYSDMRMLIVVK